MNETLTAAPDEQDMPRPILVRPGWIALDDGHWLRASAVIKLTPDELPEPEASDDALLRTRIWAGGREWRSSYTTGEIMDALQAAEEAAAAQKVAS